MALGHEMELKQLADGNPAVTCSCGWFCTYTEEKFAEPLYSRHLRMNLIPPHDNPQKWDSTQ